ncbi:MAG: VWA domain-containing protein [Bacteroidota bacterium]|nr:VWA domain-containing protein [Bacteroidota bacterium]
MSRPASFITACFLLLLASANAQNVTGKIKSTGDAQLHVIRLFADSFPQVSLTFQAETSTGAPVWNLEQKDVSVEENDQQGKITSFRLLSAEKHLQTMVVIDHSGSMATDWRYAEWYSRIDWDTIPYTDTIRYYYVLQYPEKYTQINNNSHGEIAVEGPWIKRDTFYIRKKIPVWHDYKTPLWYAQQGAKVFLNSMSQQDSCGVVGFSDFPDVEIPYAVRNESAITQIDNMRAVGATAFFDAVDRSLNQLIYHRGLRAIVALTDGADNSSKTKIDEVIAKAKKMRCPVYVIGLGDVDQVALEKLTSETGGELFLTTDATKLEEVFLKISLKLQSVYEVVYESPFLKSSDPTHELQLRFDVDSMYLKSQIIDLPLPPSVITHLEKRETQQNTFQQSFPLVIDSSIVIAPPTVNITPEATADNPPASEFPYGALAVTLAIVGAGTLVYRKAKRKSKQSTLNLVSVFPNPANGPVTINYVADPQITGLRLVVINESGIQVYSQPLQAEMQTTGIDLSEMATGIYLLRLESDSAVSATEKVVIHR